MVMPFAISLLLDTPDSQRARSYPLEHPKNILLSRPGAVVVRKCPVEFHFPRRCANRARGPARVGERGARSSRRSRFGGAARALGQRAATTSRGSRAASLTGSPLTEVNVRDGGSRHPPSCLGAPRAHAARPRRPGVPSSDGPVPGRREDRAPVATRCRPGRSRRRRRAWPRR